MLTINSYRGNAAFVSIFSRGRDARPEAHAPKRISAEAFSRSPLAQAIRLRETKTARPTIALPTLKSSPICEPQQPA